MLNLVTTNPSPSLAVFERLLAYSNLVFSNSHSDEHKIAYFIEQLAREVVGFAVAPARLNEVYGRNVICSDTDNEIMIAQWRPGMECAPHDHGHSQGRVLAITGEFVETSFAWDAISRGLVKTAETQVQGPSLMGVDDGDIHSLRCVSSGGGITLHLYRPPIRDMRVYDHQRRCTYVVTDDCGAWTPRPGQLKEIETW